LRVGIALLSKWLPFRQGGYEIVPLMSCQTFIETGIAQTADRQQGGTSHKSPNRNNQLSAK
jgi:hypothetical protein